MKEQQDILEEDLLVEDMKEGILGQMHSLQEDKQLLQH
jgi:hypothetical protein